MSVSKVMTIARSPVMSAGASAVAGGAWALVPVGRVRGLARVLLVGVPAAAATAVVASRQQGPSTTTEGERSLAAAVVRPAAAGVTVAFTHGAALAVDRGVESLLLRRGVRRPRLVMATAAAAITALLVAGDRPAAEDGAAGRTPQANSGAADDPVGQAPRFVLLPAVRGHPAVETGPR